MWPEEGLTPGAISYQNADFMFLDS